MTVGLESNPVAERALTRRATQGTYWTVGGYAGEQGLRFVGNVVLAWLLTEADFGINVLVSVFLQGLHMFSDIGIQPSVVRSPRGDDRRFLDTAWTLQLLRGICLCGVAILAAAPFARFYEEPLLAELIPVAALVAVFDGATSTKLVSAQRHLQVRRLVFLRVVCQSVGLTVTVVHGALTHSVWCLVVGAVVTSVTRMLLSFLMLPGAANRPCLDRAALTELLTFGRWIFVSTALTFLATYVDRLIFGAVCTKAELGVYHVAATLALMPSGAISQLMHNVVFPLYSRVGTTGETLRDRVSSVRTPLLQVSGCAIACMIAGGDAFVRCVYPVEFHDAGWMFQMLSVAVWILVLENQAGSALLAVGQPRSVAAGSGVKALLMLPAIAAGFQVAATPGAIGALLVTELSRYLVVAHAAAKHGLSGWRDDVSLSIFVLLTGAAGAALSWGVLNAAPPVLALLAGVAATASAWAPRLLPMVRAVRTRAVPVPRA